MMVVDFALVPPVLWPIQCDRALEYFRRRKIMPNDNEKRMLADIIVASYE